MCPTRIKSVTFHLWNNAQPTEPHGLGLNLLKLISQELKWDSCHLHLRVLEKQNLNMQKASSPIRQLKKKITLCPYVKTALEAHQHREMNK